MALKQVKNKIASTKKTGQVTKAMEAVSAVKMRKSQTRALSGKAYAEAALRILARLSQNREVQKILNGPANAAGTDCLVVITSDKGLAGALNSSVLKLVEEKLVAGDKGNIRAIAFGRKAVEYLERAGVTIDAKFTNVNDEVFMTDVEAVASDIMIKFQSGHYRRVTIAYQSFVSTFEQNAVARQLLPLEPVALSQMIADIVPGSNHGSDKDSKLPGQNYTVEPDPEIVFESLLPQLIKIMLYHSLLESKASEHSARMVAMKNATDKSKEMIKSLTILYNKERQAAITAEVSEITAGVEALKH